MTQCRCRTVVVVVGMGDQDHPNLAGINPDRPDAVQQIGQLGQTGGVQQDQSIPGIDQMRGAPGVSHEVKIAPDSKGRFRHPVRVAQHLIGREGVQKPRADSFHLIPPIWNILY